MSSKVFWQHPCITRISYPVCPPYSDIGIKQSWQVKFRLAKGEDLVKSSYIVVKSSSQGSWLIYSNDNPLLFKVGEEARDSFYTTYLQNPRLPYLISDNSITTPHVVLVGGWRPPTTLRVEGTIKCFTNKRADPQGGDSYTIYVIREDLPYIVHLKEEPLYQLIFDQMLGESTLAVGAEPYYPLENGELHQTPFFGEYPSPSLTFIQSYDLTPIYTIRQTYTVYVGSPELPFAVIEGPFLSELEELLVTNFKFNVYVGSRELPFIVAEPSHPYYTFLQTYNLLEVTILGYSSCRANLIYPSTLQLTLTHLDQALAKGFYLQLINDQIRSTQLGQIYHGSPLRLHGLKHVAFSTYFPTTSFQAAHLSKSVLPSTLWRSTTFLPNPPFQHACMQIQRGPKLLYLFQRLIKSITILDRQGRTAWFDLISFLRIMLYHFAHWKYVRLVIIESPLDRISIQDFSTAHQRLTKPVYFSIIVTTLIYQLDSKVKYTKSFVFYIWQTLSNMFQSLFNLHVPKEPVVKVDLPTSLKGQVGRPLHEFNIESFEWPTLYTSFTKLQFTTAQTSRHVKVFSPVSQHIILGFLPRERLRLNQSTRLRSYPWVYARMVHLVSLAASGKKRKQPNAFHSRWSHWGSLSTNKVRLLRRFIYSRERLNLEIKFLALNAARHEYLSFHKHKELRETFIKTHFSPCVSERSYDIYPKWRFIHQPGSGRWMRREAWWRLTISKYYSASTIRTGVNLFNHKLRRKMIKLRRARQYRYKQEVLGFEIKNSSNYILYKLLEEPERPKLSKLYSSLNRDLFSPQPRGPLSPYLPIFSHSELASIRLTFNSVFNISKGQVRSILRVAMLINQVWLDARLIMDRKVWILRTLRKHFFQIVLRQHPEDRFLSDGTRGGVSPIWIPELQQDDHNLLIHLSDVESDILRSDSYCSALFSVLWFLRDLKSEIRIQPITSVWASKDLLERINTFWLAKEIRINWLNLGFLNDKYNWYGRVGQPNINALAARAFATGVAYRGWSYQYDLFEKYDKKRTKFYWRPRWAYRLYRLNLRFPLWNRSSNLDRRALLRKRQFLKSFKYYFTHRVRPFQFTVFSDYRGSERLYHMQYTYESFVQNRARKSTNFRDHRRPIWRYRIKPNANGDHYWLGRGKTKSAQMIYNILLYMCKTPKWAESWSHNFIRVPGSGLKSFSNKFRPYNKLFWLPSETLYNHVLVRIAANRLRRWRYYDYSIAGSSVFLFDARVARMYIAILSNLGIEVERVSSNSFAESRVVEVATKLFRPESHWDLRSAHIIKLQKTYPTLAKYWGYRLNRHWLMPRWYLRKVMSEWGPLAWLWWKNYDFSECGDDVAALTSHHISSTAACLLFTLESAPRYRENDSLNPFRTHKIPRSLKESILRYTWRANPWRRVLALDSNDILENPGIKYVKLIERISTEWLERIWKQSVRDTNALQQLKTTRGLTRQHRVRQLRRTIKHIPLNTVRLRLRDPAFISQLLTYVESSKLLPPFEIPLTSFGRKDWLCGTSSFALVISEVRTWVTVPPYKNDIDRRDFVDNILLTTLEEVITTFYSTGRLTIDDLILLQEISHDLLYYTWKDPNVRLYGESITVIDSH